MTTIDLTTTDLTSLTAVELRKVAAVAGVKGAAKGRKADLLAALAPIQDGQRAAKETPVPAKVSTGSSKAGMEIKAKGNKVEVFKAAAEAAGFQVTVQVETYEGGNTRTYATATFGGVKGEHIVLSWDGAAYDYKNSQAGKDGKVRKVRNLSEALRLLER